MLQSSYQPDTSAEWDTNWARNFLKISEDQLSRLQNIPEWLPNTSLEKSAVNQEICAPDLQKEPLLPGVVFPENSNKDIYIEKKDICFEGKKNIEKGALMDSDFDIGISYSQPDMGSYKSTPVVPRPLEKLDDHILSHKYLKKSTPIPNELGKEVVHSSEAELLKASEPVVETLRPELSVMQKKACDVEMPKQTDNESVDSKKTSEVVSTEVNAVVEENHSDKPEVISHEEISNSKLCTAVSVVEDSFRCESIPCGQPVNVVVTPSPPPVNSSAEVENKHGDGLEKVDTVLRSPVKDKVLLSSPQMSGTNRKRKSKEETPKHLKNAKRPRKLDIHFTSDQVKNMLQILRLSHS